MIYDMDKCSQFPILQDVTDSRYLPKVLYPIDMKTLIARVEQHFYRRHSAIKYDIKFMEANVRKLVKSVKRDPDYRFDEQIAKRLKYNAKFVTALCLVFADTHDCHNPYDLYPHIDDYLETHDVKCYSAKRVHLNTRKKYPNVLPVPHKRLPRPQSFGHSGRTLKMFNTLRNARLPAKAQSADTLAAGDNGQQQLMSTSDLQKASTSGHDSYGELIVAHSNRPSQESIDYDYHSDKPPDYSSDVSRSEV